MYDINWEFPKVFEDLVVRKRVEKWQFSGKFGRISREKGPFRFVPQCYIWAFSG